MVWQFSVIFLRTHFGSRLYLMDHKVGTFKDCTLFFFLPPKQGRLVHFTLLECFAMVGLDEGSRSSDTTHA